MLWAVDLMEQGYDPARHIKGGDAVLDEGEEAMGEIDDAIERADRESFTRQPPKTLQARINFLIKQLKTTKAVAAELGVSQRSAERYRKDERKHPPKNTTAKIDDAVRRRWQPQIRKRRRKQAVTTGITGRPGPGSATPHPSAPPTTHASAASPSVCPRPTPNASFNARDAGAGDQQLRQIIAEGFKDVYFQNSGNRATALTDITPNDIDYLDIDY